MAALAVPIAGNMQMGLELLHGNGVGSDALWAWLDVRDISGPASAGGTPRYESTGWWWWRTSRVIHEYHLSGRSEEGLEPIVEIPAFSFVLGDLHPHVLALPFAFLSIAVALAWLIEIRDTKYEIREPDPDQEQPAVDDQSTTPSTSLVSRISHLVSGIPLPLWLFTAVVLGGLSFLNTWDVAIHLFLVLGAFFIGHWFRQGTTRGLWWRSALMGAALVAAAVLLYLPFYLGFRSQAGAPFILPFLMRPTRLAHYLIIFGMPMLVITVFLVTLAVRQRFRHWRTGLGAVVALVGALLLVMLLWTWLLAAGVDSGRIINLAGDLGLSLSPRPEGTIAAAWGARAVLALLPSLLAARLMWPWLALYLAGLPALVVMILREGASATIAEPATSEPPDSSIDIRHAAFPLLLILTGLLLTLGPEFVYLRDNFGVRLNTTFKFYYQAWAMFGVAAVFALDYLWATRRKPLSTAVAAATTAGYAILLLVALLFPVYAVRSRADEYRGAARAADGTPQERQPATLDGMAWIARFNPAEYEALMWLKDATKDAIRPPVVLEAVGGQYSGCGRVSANTGLPTLLGWPGHELQWRGSDHPEPGRREPIVEQIYTALDLNAVSFLLDEFDVAYIYVGDLEREQYGPVGLEKFAEGLEVAFANDRVTIYRWQPAAQ